MTALVTGAGGFVGSRLCAALAADGIKVRALHRHARAGPWESQTIVDLGRDTIPSDALAGIDTIFHLAGNAHVIDGTDDPDAHARVTVDGTASLLAAAGGAGVRRIVFVSSTKAVGEPGPRCVDDTFDAPPATAYGLARRRAEDAVLDWGMEPGRHGVVLRPPLVMGAGARGNLRRMLEAVQAGRFPPLPEFGNRRSLVHVDDLVAALRIAAANADVAGERWFVCHPHAYSTREMADVMAAAAGRPLPRWDVPRWALRVAARAGDVGSRLCGRHMPLDSAQLARLAEWACFDPSRFTARTGFVAERDLESAVREMLAC